MTSLDRSGGQPSGELEAAFADHLSRDAVDIVQDEDTGEIEVHADDWTLALQGVPPTVAFFAVDDEPGDEREMAAAIDAVLGDGDLDALRRLDRGFDGALASALRASGDPLSGALAERITG